MTFELTLMATAIHILIWEKLPEWGTWFNTFIAALPRPLSSLYEQWHCPYCAGFWIALVLHGLTGFWTIPDLASLPGYLSVTAIPIGWILDALATATMVYAAIIGLKAIGLPAMKAHMMKEDFMKFAFKGEDIQANTGATSAN
ncbi:hypothetical protein PhaeoP23_01894 [Phaeobacter piscinae]|uniref:DUF1360 domain-containing protein n=1 Tax=Phaeobacter piscinae TaxID=1580596 RepID=A0ABM7D780_9RHOB|nr:hypothetical protein [Phaeobacter piscinae]ATG36034.1 hypothetical protein PhaeoP36_01894 [Phaeobacter piscinae]AUQ86555.1 hypothetical protein PhaeoP42_01895 [Phaeobacter piscinae]AUR24438.1 hypothetical protein PhaeoP23_01894 [Phaeobacter piscinae]